MDYSELKSSFTKQRTGLVGLGILGCLIIASIFTIIAIPVDTYKNWNNPASWTEFPKSAQPLWINWFSVKKIPEHLILDSYDTLIMQNDMEKIVIQKFDISYSYDYFPGEFLLKYKTEYSGSPVMHISVTRPDGLTLKLLSTSLPHSEQVTVYSDKIFSTKIGRAHV